MEKIFIFSFFISFMFALTSVRNDLQFDFLNLGVNAKVQALGNTGIVNAVDAEAVLCNPANLSMYPHRNFVFGVSPLYYDSSQLYLFYSTDSFQDLYTKTGVGFVRFSVAGLEERGIVRSDNPSSVFSVYDQAFIVAASKTLSNSTSIGFNLGIIESSYRALNDDLFMTFGVNHIDRNLKAKLNSTVQVYNNYGYKIAVGGLTYFHPEFIPTLTLEMFSHNSFSAVYLSAGLEYLIDDNQKILFGYHQEQFSVGLGTVLLDNLVFYYSLTFADLGARHSFSFSMNL